MTKSKPKGLLIKTIIITLSFLLYLLLTGLYTRLLFVHIDNIKFSFFLAIPFAITVYLIVYFLFKKNINNQEIAILGLIIFSVFLIYGWIINPRNFTVFILPYVIISCLSIISIYLLTERKYIATIIILSAVLISVFLFNYRMVNVFHKNALSEYNLNPVAFINNLDNFEIYNSKRERFDSKNLTDKVVLINLWSPGCFYVKEKMQALAELHEEFEPYDDFLIINILSVNLSSDENPYSFLKRFEEHEQLPFKTYYDKDQKLFRSLNIGGMPVEILINSNMEVVSIYSGFSKEVYKKYKTHNIELINSLLQ